MVVVALKLCEVVASVPYVAPFLLGFVVIFASCAGSRQRVLTTLITSLAGIRFCSSGCKHGIILAYKGGSTGKVEQFFISEIQGSVA
ncbi:hypothetical protein Sjap_012384 [Stephania japonica]|uniref:Uncharacterized protein n=1 Tax=Stephania japonica TaxID=461633 RepID=A0AAP0NWQ5_9MAGN